ncbi:hypothetical protein [Streptomyces odontomachi]|nr:hypothetical protein [Streptomyces sp. ODS25]
MKHGIRIPALAVRVMVGVLAAATVAAVAFSASDMLRYAKMSRM